MKTFGAIMIGVLIFIGISVALFTCNVVGIGAKHVTNSVENAVINYNEYQDIYATCQKIDEDLQILRETPDTDKQFDQFSKNAMINTKKQQLTRWVNEYNAKSKHIDKKWWKSSELPYELSVNQFSNYVK